MANVQYSLDGHAAADFNPFVDGQNYSVAFETALKNAATAGLFGAGPLDFVTENGPAPDWPGAGVEGVVVNGSGDVDFANLETAPIVLFQGTEGVSLDVDGDYTAHFIGLTGGDDSLVTDAGVDDRSLSVDGGDGNDFIQTGYADDNIWGGTGDDTIDGGRGNDAIDGGSGNDVILGNLGNDKINAGSGDDNVNAGSGNDTVLGGSGNDVISGGTGNDLLDGGSGNDKISGGDGDDMLLGGTGTDTLDGGSGFDVAVINANKPIAVNYDAATHTYDWGTVGSVKNVEFQQFKDGVQITVHSADEAEVARLYQIVNDTDPNASQYKAALDLLHSGHSVLDIVKSTFAGLDVSTPFDDGDPNANSDFVNSAFHHIGADTSNPLVAHYIEQLDAGALTKADVVAAIAHNVALTTEEQHTIRVDTSAGFH